MQHRKFIKDQLNQWSSRLLLLSDSVFCNQLSLGRTLLCKFPTFLPLLSLDRTLLCKFPTFPPLLSLDRTLLCKFLTFPPLLSLDRTLLCKFLTFPPLLSLDRTLLCKFLTFPPLLSLGRTLLCKFLTFPPSALTRSDEWCYSANFSRFPRTFLNSIEKIQRELMDRYLLQFTWFVILEKSQYQRAVYHTYTKLKLSKIRRPF